MQDQDENEVEKKNEDRVIGCQSNKNAVYACDNNDDDYKALDLSFSSCTSEILIGSESD